GSGSSRRPDRPATPLRVPPPGWCSRWPPDAADRRQTPRGQRRRKHDRSRPSGSCGYSMWPWGNLSPAVAPFTVCSRPCLAVDRHLEHLENGVFKIMHLGECPTNPMEPGRGDQIKLINTSLGTEKIDLHLNRLVPGGPRGKLHHHTHADNV